MSEQPTPAAPKRRYPHVYYPRARRPEPQSRLIDPYEEDDGYGHYYYGVDDPRDLPDPRDMDRGDEPPDEALPSGGAASIWKWLLVIIMILVVVSMIAADLGGIVTPPDIIPTPTRPIIPL